jgi:murein DD-endopeptidase MepM/ murein hydrolase activator NlpD
VDTFSQAALVLLLMVAFNNYRNGTLGDWLKAKFLNKGAPAPAGDVWGPGADYGGGEFDTGGGGGGFPKMVDAPSTFLGKLLWPVTGGKLTGNFGDARPGHTHEGVDEAVPIGTNVAAAGAGTVTYAGPSAGYGLRVDIDHGGGLVTRYAHLSRADVRVGGQVRAGDRIGLSGNTGDSTGPHLHFEVRQGGVAVDPLPYLGPAGQAAVA